MEEDNNSRRHEICWCGWEIDPDGPPHDLCYPGME
jgi:hypothetical protein